MINVIALHSYFIPPVYKDWTKVEFNGYTGEGYIIILLLKDRTGKIQNVR